MDRISQLAAAIYQAYLDRGEFAYQWSPQANRAVFFRGDLPFTGSDDASTGGSAPGSARSMRRQSPIRAKAPPTMLR